MAQNTLPLDSKVLVVSRGDDELLRLGDRCGWHFPRTETGVYAGYHPADSAAATSHLEGLRGQGAEFLLLPNTSFWWLDYYAEFRQHLEEDYRKVWGDETCVIFDLREPVEQPKRQRPQANDTTAVLPGPEGKTEGEGPPNGVADKNNAHGDASVGKMAEGDSPNGQRVRQTLEAIRRLSPPGACVLVISGGDDELLNLEGRQVWPFPQTREGAPAGHHPADSAAAIAQLEELRAKGAGFLLLPSTSFWWLDTFEGFRHHLDDHYRRVWSDEHCIVYHLAKPKAAGLQRLFHSLWPSRVEARSCGNFPTMI